MYPSPGVPVDDEVRGLAAGDHGAADADHVHVEAEVALELGVQASDACSHREGVVLGEVSGIEDL